MAKCNNCSMTLSCGCKKRTAKDGKSCCASCLHAYNASLGTKPKAVKTNSLGEL